MSDDRLAADLAAALAEGAAAPAPQQQKQQKQQPAPPPHWGAMAQDATYGAGRAPRGAADQRPRYRGLISGRQIDAAALYLMRTGAILLMVLSVYGSYYGPRGMDAPIDAPILEVIGRMVGLLLADPSGMLSALLAQGVLSVAQWYAARRRRAGWRFLALYGATLAISAYWNWGAYGDPLIRLGLPLWGAALMVMAGDIAAELGMTDPE